MNNFNIRNEWANDNAGETSNINRASSTKQTEIPGKLDENKLSNSKTPNPANAPLNYIDNMWEREEAQKKYEKEVEKIEQELTTILSAYEDKWNEINKFREAKIGLEVELQKIMWTIIKEMNEDDEMLLQIYRKIGLILDDSEDAGENWDNEDTEDNNSETENIHWDELENIEWDNDDSENENYESKRVIIITGDQIKKLLKQAWYPVSDTEEWKEWEELDNWEDWEEEWDNWWNPIEIINQFLYIKDPDNRDNFKEKLEENEISIVNNLYERIKESVNKYRILIYQIKNIENRISQSEKEYNAIGKIYNQKKDEGEKLEEKMQKQNESFFLNSYSSPKKVSLDSFVSSPLVEKQISNIIELNKQWKPIPKTILLCWSMNSWKSYAANVLAKELWRKMYHIKSYDIFTWWFSDPNAMLDAIFTWAIKQKESCIIFLDEIESYTEWYDGIAYKVYKNLLENTIRHHVSKIKESDLDIIVIWAISDIKKVWPKLLKQDVFSDQIYFTWLDKERTEKLFNKIIEEKNIKLWNDVNIHKIFEEKLKNINIDIESLKKIITFASNFHKLNEQQDSENISLTQKDFEDAINYFNKHISSWKVWYYLDATTI